jgi:sec-independent protein translocase protein TatC
MSIEPEDGRPEFADEEGGGPVKTFLEHLEDLRWTLIKAIVSILVAMLVCLVAGNHLVWFLTWPLRQAGRMAPDTRHVPVVLGTNVIGKLPVAELGALATATNHIGSLKLVLRPEGTNLLLAAVPEPDNVEWPSANSPVLKNYTPLGGIMVALKLAIYGGIILASPFVLYFVGQFVLPALKVKEKKILFRAVAFGSVLFFLGVAFCYLVVAGVALVATVQFSQWMGFGADEWRAEDYIGFICKFMLGMGVGFELPVVILTLVKVGLLDYEKLAKFRSYAIVGNLIIAAFATPSADPFTMFLMALPLQFLYEISTFIAWYWAWRDRKKAVA